MWSVPSCLDHVCQRCCVESDTVGQAEAFFRRTAWLAPTVVSTARPNILARTYTLSGTTVGYVSPVGFAAG